MLPPAQWLPGLVACLACGAVAVPLRHTPERAPSSRQPGSKCNIQELQPHGSRFLVDNSRLNAKTRGLSYRFSKSGERDEQSVALWGTEVMGVDTGDGWVKVGDCFLPMMLKDVPVLRSTALEGAAELWQRGAARAQREGQLERALAEAAEVAEALTAKLRRSEGELGRLRSELERQRLESGRQLAAAEAKSKELQKALAHQSPVDEVLFGSDEDDKELGGVIEELRKSADKLNNTKSELEVKLKSSEEQNAVLKRRLVDAQLANEGLTQKLDDGTAPTFPKMDEQLESQKKEYEATIQELIMAAQRTSKKTSKTSKVMRDLRTKVSDLEDKLAGLQGAANATAPPAPTAPPATGAAGAAGDAGAPVADAPAAEATQGGGDAYDELFAPILSSSGAASTADASGLQIRLEASERKRWELEKKVKEVQAQSDEWLVMASNNVKDIQKKLLKNNHTFQLRFEACERRNLELTEDLEADKQDLIDELEQLRGGGAAGEAGAAAAGAPLPGPRDSPHGKLRESLKAENKELLHKVSELTREKAEVKMEKEIVRARANECDEDRQWKMQAQEKTAALVDSLQVKFAQVEADANQRIQACQQRLPAEAPQHSGAAGAGGLGAAAALLLAGLLAA